MKFDEALDFGEMGAPSTPGANRALLYVKADGHLYTKDDAGVERHVCDDIRVVSATDTATLTPDITAADQWNMTAQAQALTIANPTGTAYDGQRISFRLKGTAARTVAWGTSYLSSGVATLLATTATTKTHWVHLRYDSAVSKWVCLAVDAVGY